MASRIHAFDPRGPVDAPFPPPACGGDAPPPSAEPWTVSPRTEPPSAEPVTVRSGRPEADVTTGPVPVEVDALAQSGEVPLVGSPEVSVDVDFDDEPCPETLRSPVSEGVSPNVQRSRVA